MSDTIVGKVLDLPVVTAERNEVVHAGGLGVFAGAQATRAERDEWRQRAEKLAAERDAARAQADARGKALEWLLEEHAYTVTGRTRIAEAVSVDPALLLPADTDRQDAATGNGGGLSEHVKAAMHSPSGCNCIYEEPGLVSYECQPCSEKRQDAATGGGWASPHPGQTCAAGRDRAIGE